MSVPNFEFIRTNDGDLQVKEELKFEFGDDGKVVDVTTLEASFVRTNKTRYGEVFMVDVNRLVLICSLCDELHASMHQFGEHIREKHLDIDFKVSDVLDVKIEEGGLEPEDEVHARAIKDILESTDNYECESSHQDAESYGESDNQGSELRADSDQESESVEKVKKAKRPATKTDFFCEKCNRYYKNGKSFKLHVKSQHESVLGEKRFFCEKCNRQYKNAHTLNYHLKSKHGNERVTANSKLKCRYCDKEFPTEEQLVDHRNTHDRLRPYQCPQCPQKFTCNNHLENHTNSHKGIRPYKCTQCPAAFGSKCNMRQHLYTHAESRKFGCEICGKVFNRQGTKDLHMRSHTGEKPFQCELCGRTFIRQTALTEHMKRHNDTRNHECDVCGKKFYTNVMLKHHKVSHSTDRPFVCTECGKTFPRKISLKKHRQLHSDVKQYSCEVCGKEFRQYAGLYAHRKSHGERKALPKTHIAVSDKFTPPTNLLILKNDES